MEGSSGDPAVSAYLEATAYTESQLEAASAIELWLHMHSHSHGHGPHKSPHRDKSQHLETEARSLPLEILLLSSLILIDSNIKKI